MSPQERTICLKLLSLFTIDGKPADTQVTEGQISIFYELVFRKNKRVEINCSTQYGKSLIVALACVVITCIQKEVVVIVAPTGEKSKIIMRYYISHLGDSPNFYKCLEKNTKLERLQLEENKERVMLNNGGGIFVISAQARDSQKGFTAAMGEGAKIVVIDEAALIPDPIEATIFRMLAGKGADAFYCKIGNPFYRNHFKKSWDDTNYKRILIDYKQGLNEGRYIQEFINEAKKKPYFDILFGCNFPPEDVMDDKGYIKLFTEEELDKAKQVVEPFGELRLGADIAEGGGDSNVIGLRAANYATILMKFKNADTMVITGHLAKLRRELGLRDENIFGDEIGVGKGVLDRLHEQRIKATGVKFSERADDDTQFANLRSECYWKFKEWVRSGGCLDPEEDWSQLLEIKYRVDSSGKMIMMPKEEMRKLMYGSPDVPDAIAMTFSREQVLQSVEQKAKRDELREFDFYRKPKSLTGSRYLRQ